MTCTTARMAPPPPPTPHPAPRPEPHIDPADHIGLAWMVAGRMAARSRGRYAPDELVGYAMQGIINAARLYDASKGAFSSYAVRAAERRVARGAMAKRVQVNGEVRFVSECSLSPEARDTRPAPEPGDGATEAMLLRVAEALESYPYRQWAIAFVAVQQGATFAEVARLLGVSHQRVHQACKRVREWVSWRLGVADPELAEAVDRRALFAARAAIAKAERQRQRGWREKYRGKKTAAGGKGSCA